MFYEMVHEMALEMAFIVFAIWVAMTVLEKRQIVFRWAVICGVLLFGIAALLGMPLLALVLQQASLCLLLLGWLCRVHWRIKHRRSEKNN